MGKKNARDAHEASEHADAPPALDRKTYEAALRDLHVELVHKRSARLSIISHLLSVVPYERIPRKTVTLPQRQKAGSYREPDYPYRYIAKTY